ncbi:MAG: aspartate 1-decarboxylase [Veillonellaceae bacterium]|nr:aspartate 1-decarboxylase [Veillonellaceae bacterium]
MEIQVLQGKIHRAVVTQAELDYVGSITVDEALLEAAGIREYQRVDVVNIDNGARLATYTIAGERDSGVICLNGAAAHCAAPGHRVIIMAYATMTPNEAIGHRPLAVFVDEDNKISRVTDYERHGRLSDMN